MDRPSGVLLIGAFVLVLGLSFLAASGYGIIWLANAPIGSDSWGLGAYIEGAFLIVMVIVFAIGVLICAIGIGLLSMKRWARALTEALAYLNLTWVGLGVLGLLSRIIEALGPNKVASSFFTSASWVTILLTTGAVNGWVAFYLSRPAVRQAFGEKEFRHLGPLA